MLMGMSVGICRICGERKPLTFEHIPPRATGNDHTVKVYTAYREHGDGGLNADAITRSMFGDGDLDDLKYRQSQRGMGVETICRDCNSYLGINYVQPFVGLFDDVRQSATNVLAEIGGRKGQAVGLDLRGFPPLAFFKQVVSNFCATADGMLDCKDFLLDRENTDFPERYRLHMFIVPDLGAYKLMTGWMAYLFKGGGACCLACVEYPPFGFVQQQLHERRHRTGADGLDAVPAVRTTARLACRLPPRGRARAGGGRDGREQRGDCLLAAACDA